jgi:uncharacterized protein YjbI with pentapeptide repeats
MANPEHLALLNQGVHQWNMWRSENRNILPDADLAHANISRAKLFGADLSRAKAEASKG